MKKHSKPSNWATFRQDLRRADFPHLRDGGKWLHSLSHPSAQREGALDRLLFYAAQLEDLGMDRHEIVLMFLDICWDCASEIKLNREHRSLPRLFEEKSPTQTERANTQVGRRS
jgi:hypothetical protein